MEKETLGTFFNDVKDHSQKWVETKLNVYKLKGIRFFSRIAGNFAWLIISLFLFFILSVFIGLTLGFWLSDYFGSYTAGFGIVTLLILMKIALLAIFRKRLFINPIIRAMIRRSSEELKDDEQSKSK